MADLASVERVEMEKDMEEFNHRISNPWGFGGGAGANLEELGVLNRHLEVSINSNRL
jgi:hypothetical protein